MSKKKKELFIFSSKYYSPMTTKTLCVVQSSNLKNISTLLETYKLCWQKTDTIPQNYLASSQQPNLSISTTHCTSNSCDHLLGTLNSFPYHKSHYHLFWCLIKWPSDCSMYLNAPLEKYIIFILYKAYIIYICVFQSPSS